MNLDRFCDVYLAERPGLSSSYEQLMRATCHKLQAFVGHPLELHEVTRGLLADWSRLLLTSQRPSTVNAKLRMVRTLLLSAYDDDLVQFPPRRNRRLPENLATPEAWTVEEVGRLLEHLSGLYWRVGPVLARDWWYSLVLTVYWSGCRISALLSCQVDAYTPGEGLTVAKQKNGRSQWYALPPACCAAIERVLPESGPIWPWPYHPRTIWLQFRRHVEAAGLPCPRTHNQLFHRLRRTNASYCAAADPAIAQRQLDHASPVTTRRYLDPRIAGERSAADVLPDPSPHPRLRVFG